MALLFIGVVYLGIGINRAVNRLKARRLMVPALLEDPSPDAAAAFYLLAEYEDLPAWKRHSITTLQFLVDVTTWPVTEVMEVVDRIRHPGQPQPSFGDTFLPVSADQWSATQLSRTQRRQSLTTCTAAVVLLWATSGITSFDGAFQVHVLAWVLVAGIAARNTLDLMSDKFLITAARRSDRRLPIAYRDVVLAAAADLIGLTLCSVVLLSWVAGRPLHLASIREQFLAVVDGGHLWQDAHRSVAAVVLGVATAAFYASLVQPLKSAVKQRRSADELVAAAEAAVLNGNPGNAGQLLEKGQEAAKAPRRAPSERSATRVAGLIALAEGRIPDAWEAARGMVRLQRPGKDIDPRAQREDGLFVLLSWYDQLKITPGSAALELAVAVPVRDSMMSYLILSRRRLLGEGSPLVATLAARLDPAAWPLTFTVAHQLDGDNATARKTLPPPGTLTGYDALWRNILARTTNLEPGLTDRIAADTEALLADIAGADPVTWPLWLRFAVGELLCVPVLFAEQANIDDELATKADKVLTKVGGDYAKDLKRQVLRRAALEAKRQRQHRRPPPPGGERPRSTLTKPGRHPQSCPTKTEA